MLTGPLWMKGALVGKVGSVFTGSGTQHGGQESTILSMIPTLLHHGMIVVGLPYSFQGQSTMDEVSGCSPYGASTITKPDGSRMPSENELAGAPGSAIRQGRYPHHADRNGSVRQFLGTGLRGRFRPRLCGSATCIFKTVSGTANVERAYL